MLYSKLQGLPDSAYDRFPPAGAVRVWTVRYLAHNGVAREAHVALPRDLGPANNPAVAGVVDICAVTSVIGLPLVGA